MKKKSKCIVKQIKRESDSKAATDTNFQSDKFIFVLDDREYSSEEVIEILKKHKEEEDKKYHKCERCGTRYLENNAFDMVIHSLDMDLAGDGSYAYGYASIPYIRGFKVLSTCGHGREIKLCDKCIGSMLDWLKEYKV